jgi:hypothetical protein
LVQPNPEQSVEKEHFSAVTRFTAMIDRTRQLNVDVGRNTLYGLIWEAAMEWVVGKKGVFHAGGVMAIKYGVASLLLDDSSHLLCVIREPLVLEALFGKDPARAYETFLQGGHSQVGLDFEDYLALRMPGVVRDLSSILNTNDDVPEQFKREWEFAPPRDVFKRGERFKDGKEPEWISNEIEFPSHLVCFPGTLMGPDLICVAQSKSSGDRLLLLIQSRTGLDESTPAAFRTLLELYENRKKSAKKVRRFTAEQKVVEEVLGQVVVVHFVVKPMNGSRQKPVRWLEKERVVQLVADRNSLGMFPSLAAGFKTLIRFKGINQLPPRASVSHTSDKQSVHTHNF